MNVWTAHQRNVKNPLLSFSLGWTLAAGGSFYYSKPHCFNRLPKGGVFVVFVQCVMNFFWGFENRTESDDAHMPLWRLKSTSAHSCVPARKPLGYVEYYAPAPVERCRFARYRSAPCSSSLLDFLKHWGSCRNFFPIMVQKILVWPFGIPFLSSV